MRTIDINAIDHNLLADLSGEDLGTYVAYEANAETTTVENQGYHIVYNAEHKRGGIVFVGSGSDGRTAWTDANSADDVLSQYLADEMSN